MKRTPATMKRAPRARRSAAVLLPLLAAALLPPLAAAPASAQPHGSNNAVALQLAYSLVRDAGLDLVAADDGLPQGALTYSRRLLPLWRGWLWAEGTYSGGSREDEVLGGQFETSLYVQTLTAGARYAVPVTGWLAPYARLSLGAHAARLSVSSLSGVALTARDWAGAFAGSALLGAEALLPRRWVPGRVTGGLQLELGYAFASPLSFQLRPEQDEDLQLLRLQGVDLGGLSLQGFQLRVGAVVRF